MRTIQQRKLPARRAFTGLAGRPLAQVRVEVTPQATLVVATPTPDRFGPLRFSEEAEKLKKQKTAERGRQRLKKKREQLAAIKQALKTPIAVIRATEKDQRRLDDIRRSDTKL